MSEYVLRIIAAAIVCGIAASILSDKTATGRIVRVLTGVLMAVTVISPLTGFSFRNVTGYFERLTAEASGYVQEGETAAREERNGIIKAQLEAYILDKAKSIGLDISVEVELDDNQSIPCAVTVTGNLSPYAKAVLSAYMQDMLGITKEHQRWT